MPKRRCRICNAVLSEYNSKDICFSAHAPKADGFDRLKREKFTSSFNFGRWKAIKEYEGAYIDN